MPLHLLPPYKDRCEQKLRHEYRQKEAPYEEVGSATQDRTPHNICRVELSRPLTTGLPGVPVHSQNDFCSRSRKEVRMTPRLEGKVALVAGATRGAGRGIA